MALSTFTSWAVPAVFTVADWAGSSVVDNLVSMAYTYLLDRMLPADSEAELKRLQTALPQITAVMGIAEALRMKHPDASQWVEQFRIAVEASQDVLDELEYKRLEDMVKKRDVVGGSTSSSQKIKASPINDDILERLKDALTMLDRAVADVEHLLQLATTLGILYLSESRQEANKVLRHETTSFLAEREVFGREAEKDKIIGWLKRPTNARLSSFGIVGVGGLGKTTLVQFAYQEMCKLNHFDKIIWVCVSMNFSVEDITRKILSELGESSFSGKPLNTLHEILKEKILSKKILLVLDDVWEDERRRDWEQLIAPLRYVLEGSKILFTTRMKSVIDLLASVTSTEHEYLALQDLGEQELRLLFYSYAFNGFNSDSHTDLQAIGDQILKMLQGSPLAAKVIGSLLNSHMNPQYWRRILNHSSIFKLEIAKDVIEVLKLSYYHLPADLQVCFRFCSIFPQDHLFDKNDLIKMWIAAGFIRQQLHLEERPEDIGEDYFNHLLRKSFFEYSKSWDRYGEGQMYVMHDLVHELAQNVSYGECCRIEPNDKPITIPSTIQHVSIRDLSLHESEIEKVSHLKNLRSLVITTSMEFYLDIRNDLIKKSLRLLKICGGHISELPKEISCLVHLRYISIQTNNHTKPFNYSTLAPLYKLYHLQVLEFPLASDNSSHSRIETTGLTNLLRLRHMRLPKEIVQSIHGFHKLTSLQELTFFVRQGSGQRINELSTLKNLRHLFIKTIENIRDPTESKSANLLGMNNLISLSLKWTSKSNPDNPEQIIDYLQPHPNLMELIVENYKGDRSPSWMEHSRLLNLSSLKLINCPVWKNKLYSWQMPYLKILDICNCPNLDKLPDMPLSLIEFRIHDTDITSLPNLYQSSGNNTSTPFSLKSSLRVVHIKRCPSLISLGFLQQNNLDLQHMMELTISDCKKLAPAGEFGKLLSLKQLSIKNCENLTKCPGLPLSLTDFCIDNVRVSTLPEYYPCSDPREGPSTSSVKSSLRKVMIKNCPNLTALNGFLQQDNIDFQSFEEIFILNCRNLVHLLVGGFCKFVSLRKLIIRECPMLMAVDNPSNLLPLAVEYISIRKCGELDVALLESTSNLANLPKLSIHKCLNISRMHSSENEFGSLSRFSNIVGCDIEHSSRKQAHSVNLCIDDLSLLLMEPLRSLRYVNELTLSNCSAIEALHAQWLLQNNKFLRELTIYSASSLKSLSTIMARLTVLEVLNIFDAPLLEELPELPASLRSLSIGNANSLNALPATTMRFTMLEELQIYEVNSLEELPELPLSLKRLAIWNASSLKSLPATIVRLTVLEELEINKANSLEELPELPASLRSLYIWGASSLKSLPAGMTMLTALKWIHIAKVDLLEELPELPASLRSLSIKDASSLRSLPTTMARLTALERLKIMKADLLEELPELPASLKERSIQGRGGRLL
ncbi:disease resistance protein RGA2-like [Carex rostrata]